MNKSETLGGIYIIVVAGIGNYYGESNDIPRRWATHRRQLSRGRHINFRLQSAWKSMGPRAFTFAVLEQSRELTVSRELRLMKEQILIKSDASCLNIRDGHEQPVTELKLPDRPFYRNRIVRLARHSRSALVKIFDEANTLLGVETIQGKFRLGTFFSDKECRLIRKKTSR